MGIWRGSLTGTNNKKLEDSTRWQLCRLAVEHPEILDARLVHIPSWRTDANVSEVGGIAPPMEMDNFQRYVAVVDVDGNAWSSRFAALLCMDSVVLKVQPTMVDYFHFQLHPWVHYIPVNANLSDLIPNIQWVLKNPNQTREIVQNAHGWCSHQMVKESLAKDVLTIWDSYVRNLDIGNRGWISSWKVERDRIFQNINEMVPVSY